MRPKDYQVMQAYVPTWAKEKWVEIRGCKAEEDNSREDEKSKRLVNEYLLCHEDKSFWKKLSVVLAVFWHKPSL